MNQELLRKMELLHNKQQELNESLADFKSKIKSELKDINQAIINSFLPYLIDVYTNWRPKIGEFAMLIDFEATWCYEVEIREINGYDVLSNPIHQRHVNLRFELNPDVNNYDSSKFVVPIELSNEITTRIMLRKL